MKYFISFIFLISSIPVVLGQAEGIYKGELSVPGAKLAMAIELLKTNENWSGTFDVPIQNIKDFALSDIKIDGTDISFSIPDIPGSANYKGTYDENFQIISGTFTQAGQQLDLTFTHVDAEEPGKDKAIVERLKVLSDSLMLAHDIPGMGFGIIKNGKVLLSEGLGYRDYDNKIKADNKTLFAIGSCTKAFTATGVAMLAEEGLIEWDEPIRSYMPDFRMYDDFASEQSTAVDILTHRSGLPRHDLMWYGSAMSRSELFERIRYLEPTKSFRTQFQYQNLMYMTAGILIERMSGKTWEEYTQEKILKPLGMNSTNISVDESIKIENHALPYAVRDSQIVKIDFRNINQIGPAGSINSNVEDMLKWAEFNLNRGKWKGQQIIGDNQYNTLHEGQMIITGPLAARGQPEYSTQTYGGGWFIYDYAGTKVVQHGGNIDGFSGYVYLLPDLNVGMVFMANVSGSPLPAVLANYATDLFLDKDETLWEKRVWPDKKPAEETAEESAELEKTEDGRIKNTKPSNPSKNYVGKYNHDGYGTIEVTSIGGKLKSNYNAFDFDLTHYHYDVYDGKTEDSPAPFKFQFHQDFSGSIQSVSVALEPSLDPIILRKKRHSSLTIQAIYNRSLENMTSEA